jgi:protein O-GlcNAc transferase
MSSTLSDPLRQARDCEARGDLAGADTLYRAAYNPRVPNVALLLAWGRLRRRAGDAESSLGLFQAAGQAGGGGANGGVVALEMAGALLDLGRAEQATNLLRQASQGGRGPALDFEVARWEMAHGRFPQAAALFKALMKTEPRHAGARLGYARALRAQGQVADAEGAYKALLNREPNHMVAQSELAFLYGQQRRMAESLALFDRMEQGGSDVCNELSQVALGMMHMGDWSQRDALLRRLAARMANPRPAIVEAYALLAGVDDPALHRLMGERFADAIRVVSAKRERPVPRPVGPAERRLRVGYLCGDFSQHATSLLLAGVLEAHDREHFEFFAYDYSAEDGSEIRGRIKAAFEHFVSVEKEGPGAAAARIAADGIDVLVDLKGYTERTRTEIMALRPAPVQVNFLGYVGTQGGDWTDYVIADSTVLPPEEYPNWVEQPVLMPASYYPNDRTRPRPEPDMDRAAHGLPETGVVFACFNNPFKISPEIFAVWMGLLRDLPDSVLWLYQGNEFIAANLCAAATAAGIDAARLVFAAPAMLEAHMARHGCVDIYLDTVPYGAHTTGADALWAGVPMITCMGRSWPSRVGGSLLRAVGLPELITESLEDYAALAKSLAGDPERRTALRAHLQAARDTAPLFDAVAFARGLESAYTQMAARSRAGEAAAPIKV